MRIEPGELIEMAAVFVAAGAAHLFVSVIGERADGAAVLIAAGLVLVAAAVVRRRWTQRRRVSDAAGQRPAALHDLLALPTSGQDLIRLRTTLSDRPGTLARLSGRLAARGINILAIQIHPSVGGAVDELLIAAPRGVGMEGVEAAVTAGGGRNIEASSADLHDLVDPATRALTLATEVTNDHRRFDGVLSKLTGAQVTAGRPSATHVVELRGPRAAPLFLGRSAPAFTSTEVSRAQAMVDLCAASRALTRRD